MDLFHVQHQIRFVLSQSLEMIHEFKTCLQNHNLLELSSIPKSDLHNHAGCGGNVNYIASQTNIKIDQPPAVFESMLHMHSWFSDNIKVHCSYLKRLEAAFVQAYDDNIHVLAMSFETDEANKIGGMDLDLFIQTMNTFNQRLAPSTMFLPELTFNRACCDVDSTYSRLDEILSFNWFKSLDICNDESAQPIKNLKRYTEKRKTQDLD